MLVLSLGFCGCSSITDPTTAVKIQTALTNFLPPDFNGDFVFSHKNPYFDIGTKVTGIHKTPDGKWSWTGVLYDRHDFFNTSGHIELIPTKAP